LFSEIKITLNAGQRYNLIIRPYSSSGSVYARLRVESTSTNQVSTVYLDSPINVSVNQNEYKVFKFTPSFNGKFNIYTYSNGSSSDTYLQLFSDQNLMNHLYYNDDSNGTLFSEMKYQMWSGKSYYIKYKGYNNSSASSYLAVTTIYQNLDLYVSKNGDQANYVDNAHVIKYTNGNIYVNLEGVSTVGLTNGTDYVIEDGKVWFSTQYLSTMMGVTTNSSSVTLNITDSTAIAVAYDNTSGGGGVGYATVDNTVAGECTSACD
jgi:hypothetical protein